MNRSYFETKRIDHLGIVAGICHEIGLIEAIDQAVGPSQRKVSNGAAVQAMVLNALGFSSRALYLMPQYMANKPVDLLIAPGLQAEDFNDDTLGRSLDQLFEAGVTEVFAQVASRALEVYKIEHRFYHLDSSSFHLHGQYLADAPEEAIEITYGYSKDHRPDLKQVVVNMITGHRSTLPVWMEALSGNESDKASFPKTIKAFIRQMEAAKESIFVVDSAIYSAENLQALKGVQWLTRVPETLGEAKRLIGETESREMHFLSEGYSGHEVRRVYGGVEQRWLVVHSVKAAKREEKTLERRIEKEKKEAEKAWRRLQKQVFNCTEDAQAALTETQRKWKYHQLTAAPRPVTGYSGRGRPRRGAQPEVIGYRLEGKLTTREDVIAQARRTLGRFILATNVLVPTVLSDKEMLLQYKAQGFSVERGFRFLKDPLFFADSLFLKNPGRIMAMSMIMVLALLIYALAERKLRLQLSETGESVPNQVGKETQRPTMRWIFQLFEGIDVLLIHQGGQTVERRVLNLKPVHRDILRLLGPPVEKCYLLPS
jgi:transposase